VIRTRSRRRRAPRGRSPVYGLAALAITLGCGSTFKPFPGPHPAGPPRRERPPPGAAPRAREPGVRLRAGS